MNDVVMAWNPWFNKDVAILREHAGKAHDHCLCCKCDSWEGGEGCPIFKEVNEVGLKWGAHPTVIECGSYTTKEKLDKWEPKTAGDSE